MRQIKFKAKRLDGKGWIEGTPICINGKPYSIMIGEKESPDIDPSTICQFTGLKDCKGNEIWEHDLLQSQETKAIYEVVWNQGNTSFSLVNTECPVLYPNTLGGMLRNRQLKIVSNKFDKEK